MWSFILILTLTFVALGLYKVVLERPDEPQKRKVWRVELLLAVLFCLLSLGGLLTPAPATKEDLDEMPQRTADAVFKIVKGMSLPQGMNDSITGELRVKAECLEKIARSAFERGLAAIGKGEWQRAVDNLSHARVALGNDSVKVAAAYFCLGIGYFHAGDMTSSLNANDSCLGYWRPFPESWDNRGTVLQITGRLGEALASRDSAIVYRRDFAWAWINRGATLVEMDSLHEAIASFDTALHYNRTIAAAWSNKASALNSLKRFREAAASCDGGLAYERGRPELWNNRAIAFIGLKELALAVTDFDTALTYDSTNFMIWRTRAAALYAMGRSDKALASIDKALYYNPRDRLAINLRDMILELSIDPLSRSLISFEFKQYEDAEKYLLHALDVVGDDAVQCAKIHFYLGLLKNMKANYPAACQHFETSVKCKPDNAATWADLAAVLANMGQLDRAKACADSALRYAPNHEPTLILRDQITEAIERSKIDQPNRR